MQFQCNYTELKITTNFSNDVHFLHTFHLKFTINTNVVYSQVEATFSTSILRSNQHSILTVGLLLWLLCPDLSDSSSLTERTSDNQRLRTSQFID